MGIIEFVNDLIDPTGIRNQLRERKKNDDENWKVVRNLTEEEIRGK